jgi:hypothetical protein
MGFDLSITLNLLLDPMTGLPFVYGKDSSKQPYVPSNFEVPVKYRKWVQQRGSIFHYYIKDIINGDTTVPSTDIHTFLEAYPDWDTIMKSKEMYDRYDDWTETHHNDFMEALRWFDSKFYFRIEWSY